MGKSKPWPEALRKMTGNEALVVGALLEYFEPLHKWLVEQRQEIRYAAPGWDEENYNTTTAPIDGVTSLVQVLLNTFACALDALDLCLSLKPPASCGSE